MGIDSFFRRISRKAAKSIDEVDRMYTRRLPIPGLANSKRFIIFFAERNNAGQWKVFSQDNYVVDAGKITTEMKLSSAAIQKAFTKHISRGVTKDLKMNFDQAFLVLRELEEAYLQHANKTPDKEPFDHYMAAYRLLPRQFQESLDEIYKSRLAEGGILPAKPTAPPQGGPKTL